MEFYQAVRERCSMRAFTAQPVEPEKLRRVLEAARRAPSWANVQATRWIVVRDAAVREQLAQAVLGKNPARQAIQQAPVVLALCYLKKVSGYYQGEPSTSLGDWGLFDAGLAAANLTLAAVAEGLGTVHVGAINLETVARVLQAPDEVQCVELLPLGYPAREPKSPPRLALEEIVFYDNYGGRE